MKIEFALPFRRVLAARTLAVTLVPDPQERTPRIARLLALAHKLDAMVRSSEITDYAKLTRAQTKRQNRATEGRAGSEGHWHEEATNAPRGGSKTEKILDLLNRPGGVTLRELGKATGWQPH
jgi:hypothetical protein